MGWFISLRIPGDGRPLMSHYDITREDLRFIRCDEATCAEGRTVNVVDTAGEVGRFNSLALGSDGLPWLSYFDVTRGDLKLAFCADMACSTVASFARPDTAGVVGMHTSAAVDTAGLAGQFASMVLDGEGRPHIAYYASGGRDLKIVRCSDADCSGKPTRHLLDSVDDVGLYSSLVFLEDGSLFIAYFDMGHYDLMGAYCGAGGGEDCWQGSMVGIRRTRAPGLKPAFRLTGTWYPGTDGMPVDLRGRRAPKAANRTEAGK